MSVTAKVSDAALATKEKLRGGIGKTKVRRYWPGKAPDWAKETEEDHEDDVLDRAFPKRDHDNLGVARNKDDPRLRRLAHTRIENREQVRADHPRVRHAAEIISTEEEQQQEETIEDEDTLEERRRIREKNKKNKRDTVAERERLEAEEEALEELAKRKLEMRKTETKQLVIEEVRKYEEIQKNMLLEEANIGDVETDDEINEAEEYEAWKTREIARIKRERDAREAMFREREEIDKLRNMTDHESKNPKPSSSAKPKKKWKFMLRYYHKGAFFQEAGSVGTDVIFQRDFSAPTGEDRLDKSVLREVMQVKHFGRSGRTKWTHLVNEDTTYGGKKTRKEDTTDWSNLWISNGLLREKYKRKMAAMDAPIAKPKGSKKMKVW